MISYCIKETTVLLIFLCANIAANTTKPPQTLDEDSGRGVESAHFPIYARPQHEYNLEEFLWRGSGHGPEDLAQDGGLAWEDGGGVIGDTTDVVRVTKTMVLFKTVMTTIYPVEMTPFVITASVSPTPRLVTAPTVVMSPSPPGVYPSDHFSPVFATKSSYFDISSTAVLTSPSPEGERGTETSQEIEYTTSPTESNAIIPEADRMYWVQTVIKANRSQIDSHPLFQGNMQKNLARVYASAFKRHLMSSLGVFHMKKDEEEEKNVRRLRRSSFFVQNEDVDTEWLYPVKGLTPSKLRSLATAAMNVTVSIMNMTEMDQLSHISLNYIVCAEGNPVPAASAVQDLNLVTKQEMEREIGYEVINKAEALVASPLKKTELELATSPWLIVAITTIILMIFLLLVIMFMVWKWKHNRLSDTIMTHARPQSGIEGGVINPAFLGPPSPIEPSGVQHELPSTTSPSTYTSHKHRIEPHPKRFPSRSSQRKEEQRALASELNILLSKKGETLREDIKTSEAPEGRYEEDTISDEGKPESAIRIRHGSSRRKYSRKLQSDSGNKLEESYEESWHYDSPPKSASPESKDKRPGSAFPSILNVPNLERELEQSSSKSVDKISYGDLEVSQEAIARPMSSKARKLLPKVPVEERGSNGQKSEERRKPDISGKDGAETTAEISDVLGEGSETKSFQEQDRDLSESSEPAQSTQKELSTKDAQVQTPTRRFKPRARKRGKHQSSESLISTESEETIEIHDIDSLSIDSNPMGKMRKRFHQFLDDAFNVIAKPDEEDPARAKSAKVSISHQVETRQVPRPWTSQVIHEEVLQRLRPKSASFGPPKRAWTGSTTSERRCNSAKSSSRGLTSGRGKGKTTTIFERDDDSDLESDVPTTTVSPAPPKPSQPPPRTQFLQSTSHVQPVFPNYSIYPDIPTGGSSRHAPTMPNRPPDPAVPLILAIKEEIKRFEKVVVNEEEEAERSKET